jgi:hypothetical protein
MNIGSNPVVGIDTHRNNKYSDTPECQVVRLDTFEPPRMEYQGARNAT